MELNTVFMIRKEVAFRKASDGTLTIVSPVTDKITTINSSAAVIWDLIDGKKDLQALINEFITIHKNENSYPGDEGAKCDIIEIIEHFFNRNLIEKSGRNK